MRKPNPQLHAIRREQILTIAAEMFANQKFHEVLMDEVARRAQLAKGTIYNYFKNKEELYFAIIIHRLEHLLELLQQRVNRNMDPLTNLRRLMIHIYSFMAKYPHFFQIWYKEKGQFRPGKNARIQELYQQIRQLLIRVLDEGVEHAILRPHNREFAADIVLGIIDAAVIRSRDFTIEQQRRERIQAYEFVLHALGTPRAWQLHQMGYDEPQNEKMVDETVRK